MTAIAVAPGWYIPDLRNSYDEHIVIPDGIFYRKGSVLQVWWTHNTLGEPFQKDVDGRETWTMPTVKDAKRSFASKWIAEDDEFDQDKWDDPKYD